MSTADLPKYVDDSNVNLHIETTNEHQEAKERCDQIRTETRSLSGSTLIDSIRHTLHFEEHSNAVQAAIRELLSETVIKELELALKQAEATYQERDYNFALHTYGSACDAVNFREYQLLVTAPYKLATIRKTMIARSINALQAVPITQAGINQLTRFSVASGINSTEHKNVSRALETALLTVLPQLEEHLQATEQDPLATVGQLQSALREYEFENPPLAGSAEYHELLNRYSTALRAKNQ